MEISLSAGTIDYVDTGGPGPVVVFLHGLMMNASLWDGVVAELGHDHRCVVPTVPLGGHQHPMGSDVDLSLPAVARMVVELLDRLELRYVTIVGNDTGGAIVQLMMAAGTDRIGQAVLVSCDAFDNFPPGLTGRTLVRAGRLSPRLFGAFMQQMRVRTVRRLPLAFGWLTKRGDAVSKGWLRPVLTQAGVRRDTVRVLRAIAAQPDLLLDAAARLPAFTRPTLVVWASEDRVMPLEHGRRLAELLPHGRLVEIADSYTLIPLDQPAALAAHVRAFVHAPERS